MPISQHEDVLKYENSAKKRGFSLVLGLDEAGRGPLAGPVVAAAVALKTYAFDSAIRDSKKLSASQREQAFAEIYQKCYVGVGIINETAIDQINILQATFVAMTNAVWQVLAKVPDAKIKDRTWRSKVLLLVDGNRFKSDLPFAVETIIGGDDLSLSIACASIVAKVTRDRILNTYSRILPQYGFDKHKGYPTPQHKQAIQTHGLSFIHRRTFRFEI